VGFNAMQPGRVKKGDLVMLVSFVVILAAAIALVFWLVR
jgi:flagellar basal body-associated protein FliL